MTTTTTEFQQDNYSNESQTTDYTSIEGVRTRTGVDKDQLFGNFIIKEVLDNALDYIEKNAKTFEKLNQNPYVDITITEEVKEEITKIRIKNSTVDYDVFSSKEQVEKIFKLDRYYSNKRHQHIIKRGALGDGLKEVLCIPYAFSSTTTNDNNWTYPLKINISNERIFEIRITNISEVKKNLEPPQIDVIEKTTTPSEVSETKEEDKFIEFTVYLPTKILTDYTQIKILLTEYTLINTHIDFKFELLGENQIYKATQNIQHWSNNQSIYYYSLPELESLIYSFEDQSNTCITAYLQRHFREGTNIKKDELSNILNNNKNIEGIYKRLKQISTLGKPQLQVPFDKKLREQALEERFKQIFDDSSSIKYKKIIEYYDNNDIEFPFMLEIVTVNILSLDKELHLIPSINFSPSLRYDPFYNQSGEKIFTWKNKNKETKSTDSISDILEDCGYSHDPKKHKKTDNVILINLISPRIDYNSHSKSDINLKPFSSAAQNIYNFCKSTKSKSGIKGGEGSTSVVNELRNLLAERGYNVRNNPQLIKTERWTQSTVFYHLRPRLIAKGMNVHRDYITDQIRQVCNDDFGKKRNELGIVAAERAQLYFKGQSLGVGFDQLRDLIEMGTDLLVIEKEGIADVLAPFADKHGIAILNSRGFLTEYATDLSRLAQEKGCNVAILTDLDSSGLSISTSIPNGYRIGIDFSTIDSLGLNPEDVEEEVISKNDPHLTSLKKSDEYEIPLPYSNDIKSEWWQMILYLHEKKKRIEIDSMLAQVGAERFWEFILEKLKNIFPTRNYNRAIDVPTFVLPTKINNLIIKIQNKISEDQSEERTKIIQGLDNVEGFLDIESKEKEIEQRLRNIVSDSKYVEELIKTLNYSTI